MPRKKNVSDYVSWEDLDLDYLLGQYTDMELCGEASDSSEDENPSAPQVKPLPKPAKSALYSCDDCTKTYRSISGFRGHMRKQHNRPDIRATDYRNHANKATDQQPASHEEFKVLFQDFCKKSVDSITKDDVQNWDENESGSSNTSTANMLMEWLQSNTMDFLLDDFQEVFSSSISSSQEEEHFVRKLHKLRTKLAVNSQFTSFLTETFGISSSQAIKFFSIFLKHFVNIFLDNKMQHGKSTNPNKEEMMDSMDKDIVCYIGGYIIRRIKERPAQYGESLISTITTKEHQEGLPSGWIAVQDRGGLLYPSINFFSFMLACEEVIRKKVDLRHLNSTSLKRDSLKEQVMEDLSVKTLWDSMSTSINTIILEKVIDLYLTVRGHATARRVVREAGKESALQKKKSKGLRKALKTLNGPST